MTEIDVMLALTSERESLSYFDKFAGFRKTIRSFTEPNKKKSKGARSVDSGGSSICLLREHKTVSAYDPTGKLDRSLQHHYH